MKKIFSGLLKHIYIYIVCCKNKILRAMNSGTVYSLLQCVPMWKTHSVDRLMITTQNNLLTQGRRETAVK